MRYLAIKAPVLYISIYEQNNCSFIENMEKLGLSIVGFQRMMGILGHEQLSTLSAMMFKSIDKD